MAVEITPTVEYLDESVSPDTWVDITADVVGDLVIRCGISGNGPTDNTAGPGTCTFRLENHPTRQYSPFHADVASGWALGVQIRVSFDDGSVSPVPVVHRGKALAIIPTVGEYGERQVDVTSYDVMRQLAEADIREIAIQLDKTEEELVDAILDNVPTESQPVSRNLATGVDRYPVAFHDIGSGVKALTLIKDLMTSSFSLAFCAGDGTFTTHSRATRGAQASQFTFLDTTDIAEDGLQAPVELRGTVNLARVTIRPSLTDPSPTTVLWTADEPIEVRASETKVLSVDYRDPDNPQVTLVGGTEIQTPVQDTDYIANTTPTGLGTDISADQVVAYTAYATSVSLSLTNNSAETAYYTTLRVVGKGIYDRAPEVYTYEEADAFGERPVNVTLRYETSGAFALAYATNIVDVWSDLDVQVTGLRYVASERQALMDEALTRTIGDVISVTESVTGLSAKPFVIQSLEFHLQPPGVLTVEYGLAPLASPTDTWLLGIVGRGELGTNTKLGF